MKGVLRLALLAGCVLAWMPLTGLADASKSLLAAAAAQDEAGARRALSAGAAVNAQDEDGWSALTYAAGAGDAALVQTLLKAGANPNLATRDG
ncbi:MAG: ankyrin repeat domain-containing protein, partial [Pseudomonadota bacterium]